MEKMKNLTAVLLRQEISFEQYAVLCLFDENALDALVSYIESRGKFEKEDVDLLIKKGFLCRTVHDSYNVDELVISENFTKLRKVIEGKNIKQVTINTWFDQWYDLFPKHVESGGYKVKSKKSDCKARMSKFVRGNNKYTKDTIISATKLYIQEFEAKNYAYMQIAPYFIYKDNITNSTLEDYCERVIDGEEASGSKGVKERTL